MSDENCGEDCCEYPPLGWIEGNDVDLQIVLDRKE